jgi:hypothetical protein
MPASAVTITFGLASSMRVASELEAKPPNTTEWMAPMRAQASMANSGLGDHRHVDQHAVALADAQRLQDRRHALTSACSSAKV